MPAISALAMFLQDNAILGSDVHQIMIAEWIIAGFFLLVVVGLLIAAIAAFSVIKKLEKKVDDTTKMVQGKAMPLLAQGQELMGKVQEIVTDLKPKIASISSDVTHISNVVKSKVDEAGTTFTQVNSTVQDVNGKAKAQAQRVNGMVSEALTTTEHVSRSIQHGIQVPITKIAGWVAAAKSGIETLGERIPFLHHVVPPPRSTEAATGSPFRDQAPASGSPYRTQTTASAARQTGTAAPGGPPFVAAPDASKRY